MAQHDPTCIEVLVDDNTGNRPPNEPVPAPRACQLVPPCKEGNHIAKAGHGGTGLPPRRIGKYFFSEDALKHDLAALRRGKVYTKQEFYRRARAWYKAEIDRILHWHKVYKENNPERPNEVKISEQKAEPIKNTGKQEDKKINGLPQEDDKSKEVDNKGHIMEKPRNGEHPQEKDATQDTKPKSRKRKVKVPAAPTRVQPSRAAKRKAEEPPPLPKATRKKKRKIEETAKEAAKPTSSDAEKQQAQTDKDEEETGETKGDYELSFDEWKIFLARYNSATTPVTPVLSPSSLSSFSQNHLQEIDVANFSMRLERIIETKIMDLIDQRQGITIDEAAGGLCLRGYYHHPFRCALDGNHVPPPRFEPAGAYSPGEDWRPPVEGDGESQKGQLADTGTKPVSPTTFRPPGIGNRIQGEIPPPSSTLQQQQQTTPAITTQTQPQPNNATKSDMSPSIPPPPPNSPLKNPPWPIREANSMQQRILQPEINTGARNSPAPDAAMEISPTLGRWRPPMTGFPLKDFAEAIVDICGLRFAVDLCAEYVGDRNGARFFML